MFSFPPPPTRSSERVSVPFRSTPLRSSVFGETRRSHGRGLPSSIHPSTHLSNSKSHFYPAPFRRGGTEGWIHAPALPPTGPDGAASGAARHGHGTARPRPRPGHGHGTARPREPRAAPLLLRERRGPRPWAAPSSIRSLSPPPRTPFLKNATLAFDLPVGNKRENTKSELLFGKE